MRIPFTKAHGAKNDFLLTWAGHAPSQGLDRIAQALCDRHTGVGADGWLLVSPAARGAEQEGSIRLFNADGSEAEISGNGTRCAAAFLIDAGLAGGEVRILTGAGLKRLRLIERDQLKFLFEMNMGRPAWSPGELRVSIEAAGAAWDATLIHSGNPQCAVFVEHFDFDWRRVGAELERHPRFPNRTNVSFVRPVGEGSIEVLFWERGAGETLSSGTGSTGAAAAAILRGLVRSPVRVLTPAGPLDLRWEDDIFLVGPAEIVAAGECYV